jgi:flagellar basal body rod protein FlgF
MRHVTHRLLITALVAALPLPLAAQRTMSSDSDWLDNCRNNWGNDRGHACEVRDVPVRLSGRALEIDGRQNGSIHVQAWDGEGVKVTARLQANAESDADAQALLKDIRITSDGRRISADAPSARGYRSGWSTSYVVMVPRRFDLELDANNGSLSVDGVSGKLDLSTTNGSVTLNDVGGDVHARTQNGSLNVQLAGKSWDGEGLDAVTQNGSVRLAVPDAYAATLETGTVNGRINTDIPITVQGRISRQLSVPLNGGGRTIRAMTTNGSVRISRR